MSRYLMIRVREAMSGGMRHYGAKFGRVKIALCFQKLILLYAFRRTVKS